jgi:chromatin remodeling complex protein RSC6
MNLNNISIMFEDSRNTFPNSEKNKENKLSSGWPLPSDVPASVINIEETNIKEKNKSSKLSRSEKAFLKLFIPSKELAQIVGSAPLPRTEVVTKLWTYIKQHDLQDKINKRNINSDEKLKAVFGKSQVTMFELASLVGKHLKG